MAAAIQEIVDRGYEGASLTRISARADVAKGLVRRYFTGKDDPMASTAKATMEPPRPGARSASARTPDRGARHIGPCHGRGVSVRLVVVSSSKAAT